MIASWPFGSLKPLSYELIFADPPWTFRLRSDKGERKSAQAHYSCMSIEEIAALPVHQLASRDCVLFLWATFPLLPEQISIVGQWGFRYVTGGVWHKRTLHGKTAFGTGYRARSACEPFLLGTIGNPETSRAERNLIEGLAREHSRKPEEAYAWCERYMRGAHRVELFSRCLRPGWDSWGHEVNKFDARAA